MNNVVMLSELCETEITDGTHQTPTYSDDGYIFLSSKNVTSGVIDWENVKYIPEKLHQELYARIKPQKDDILLAKNGTTGTAALVDRDEVFDIYVSLALIRPNKNKVLPEYLLYAINSRNSQLFFERHLKGIGVPNLHLTHIRETPIKIYSFDRQKKIVEELKCIDEVIRKHEQQIDIYNHLVKSRFVEMFGDPMTNPMRWEIRNFGDIISKAETGWSGNGTQRKKVSGELAVLKISAVTSGQFREDEYKVLDDQENIKKKVFPRKGCLIVSRANTKDLVGASVLVEKDYDDLILPDKLWQFKFEKNVNVHYMKAVMSHEFIRSMVSQSSTGTSGSMYNISMEKYKMIEIPLPPAQLQDQFADFVALTDKSKLDVWYSIDVLKK